MVFSRRETAILLIGDFLILTISLWIALILRNLAIPSFGYFQSNFIPFVPFFLLSLTVFYIAGLYEKQTRPIRRVMGIRILGAQAATVGIAAILFFILPLAIAPKTILLLYLVVSVVIESWWRFHRMRREMRESAREPALLIGTGSAVRELFEEVNHNDRFLIRFRAHHEATSFVDDGVRKVILAAHLEGVRLVVLDVSDPRIAREMPRLYELLTSGMRIVTFASLYEDIFDRVPLEHLDAEQLLESLSRRRTVYDTLKRLCDLILALSLSIIAIPFIGIAVLVLLTSGGTPFITNNRIGRSGHVFRIIKLRSMLFNDQGDPDLQKKNRVTRFGSVLRKTRIDELPQLWNIVVGDLSFIGPRPELPSIAQTYEREIPQYHMRHLIAPGLSGWAQIHDYDAPRGGADVERTRRKLSFDLYYLRHRSIGLDLAIALKTIRALASFSGT